MSCVLLYTAFLLTVLYVCCSGMCCAIVCCDMYNYQYIVMYAWVVCYCDVHVSFTSSILSYCELQESSYCYWPEDEGEEMVSGKLRVKLVKVRGHGDITERKLEVTECDSTNPLNIRMIQLTSWSLQGLPHPSAIMSLIEKLNRVLMRSSSKQTVVMCR